MDVPPLPDIIDMTTVTSSITATLETPLTQFQSYEYIIGYTRGLPSVFYIQSADINVMHVAMLIAAAFIGIRFIMAEAMNTEE